MPLIHDILRALELPGDSPNVTKGRDGSFYLVVIIY